MVEQLGYGVLVGVGVGLAGGLLVGRAKRSNWMAESSTQLALVAIPLLGALASEAVGASMFIAAFVAGLFVQRGFTDAGRHSVEFTDQWGQTLNLSVFFLFGILVARDWHGFAPRHFIYAFLSLTVVRMLPVAISLIGTRLSRATVLFMGWFGPRGLASIVLGLVYLEQKTHLPRRAGDSPHGHGDGARQHLRARLVGDAGNRPLTPRELRRFPGARRSMRAGRRRSRYGESSPVCRVSEIERPTWRVGEGNRSVGGRDEGWTLVTRRSTQRRRRLHERSPTHLHPDQADRPSRRHALIPKLIRDPRLRRQPSESPLDPFCSQGFLIKEPPIGRHRQVPRAGTHRCG